MTNALLMTDATIMLLRKSSTSHLLLLCAHSLIAQILPGEAGIEGIALGDLDQDVTWAGVGPALAQVVGQLDQDLPVGPGARQRTQRAADGLHMVIDIGHAAFFFGESHGG